MIISKKILRKQYDLKTSLIKTTHFLKHRAVLGFSDQTLEQDCYLVNVFKFEYMKSNFLME